ncbi:hypothetical protein XF_0498 [Xylella fastidiosa 9a5c]|uniref:Uncharacterized protein n=1 Tax=Xylella fastidiosa (strain 9a5c) TaxID=160492 RepID=Q9PG04_XYLFA|nr:hypothetical protein XF_0498 [Xylella fastidiosa 9a5c]
MTKMRSGSPQRGNTNTLTKWQLMIKAAWPPAAVAAMFGQEVGW